jgi:hypothetical protein
MLDKQHPKETSKLAMERGQEQWQRQGQYFEDLGGQKVLADTDGASHSKKGSDASAFSICQPIFQIRPID